MKLGSPVEPDTNETSNVGLLRVAASARAAGRLARGDRRGPRRGLVCHRRAALGAGDGLSAVPDGDRGARDRARGLVSGRIVGLWRTGEWLPRMRAILLAVSVTGDWLMVVVTVAELAVSAAEAVRSPPDHAPARPRLRCRRLLWHAGLGLNFLGTTTPSMDMCRCSPRSGRCAGRITSDSCDRRERARSKSTWTWTRAAGGRSWPSPGPCLLRRSLAAAIPLDSAIARSPLVRRPDRPMPVRGGSG